MPYKFVVPEPTRPLYISYAVFCLNCHPCPHAGALRQGQQLLNTVIVSFYSRKFNDNSTKMMQFPQFSLPFLTISRI